MANTTERVSTLTITRAANESSSNVITFWNDPRMKFGASGHSFSITTATTYSRNLEETIKQPPNG